MGQLVVKLSEPRTFCGSVADLLSSRHKRKRGADSTSVKNEGDTNDATTPKKRKLLTTTQYIYQALFKEQKNADIRVMALGKVWHLHKIYLSQSPYFCSMFNGSWKESMEDFVHIKIIDEKITIESLDAVFGALYSDEIEIDANRVISTLATATLFHLDGIIDKCAEVMVESINADTAVTYYEVAVQFGCLNAKRAAFEWLEINLLCVYGKNHNLLRQISVELMTTLVSSPDLYVMQTEFSLYTLLRTWMYLRMHPNLDPNQLYQQRMQQQEPQSQPQQSQQQQQQQQPSGGEESATNLDIVPRFFTRRDKSCSFLGTPEGQEFIKPFQALRTQYLINHHMDLTIVLSDNIIPKEWVHSHVLSHWNAILRVDHNPDLNIQNLDPDVFYRNCMRCGRILMEPGYQKWRWTGFNFGLDLILIADSRMITVRRHHRNEHERLLSLQTKRHFMIRAAVTSINGLRQPVFTQKSQVISLSLEKNEEITLLVMENRIVHPILISVNVLAISPENQDFKQHISESSDDATNTIPISDIGANCERRKSTRQVGDDDAPLSTLSARTPRSPYLPRSDTETLPQTPPVSSVSLSGSGSGSGSSSIAYAASIDQIL